MSSALRSPRTEVRSGYRWVVLAAVMAVNATIQLLWVSYSPITSVAQGYYGVSALAIGAFSMVFMVAFVPLSIPASWLIDTRGLRFAVGLGSIGAGVGGVLRGLAGDSYAGAMAACLLIAACQPLLLNCWTVVSDRWFPPHQRATAVSLITLANLAGTAVGLVLTPVLLGRAGIGAIQVGYGLVALAAAAVFVVLARDGVATGARALVLDGLRHALRVRPFLHFLALAFVCLGVFNGVTTWVEPLIGPRGYGPEQAGTVGAVILLAGVLGAVALSAWSDRLGRRVPFLAAGLLLAVPGLLGVTFARPLWLLLASAAVLGFFLTSVLPIGIQYSAEITRPTPEGTSSGLIQLAGQGSVLMVFALQAMRTADGSFAPGFVLAAGLLLLAGLAAGRLLEPRSGAVQD